MIKSSYKIDFFPTAILLTLIYPFNRNIALKYTFSSYTQDIIYKLPRMSGTKQSCLVEYLTPYNVNTKCNVTIRRQI